MAITVTPQISGQSATSTATYCYIYEPLRVFVQESDLAAEKLKIDISLYNTSTGALIETLPEYAIYDINSGVGLTIDLMKIAQQINDANIYKFSSVDDISGANGYKSIIADYKYNFAIYSDKTTAPINVLKVPLIGGRDLEQFTSSVLATSPINEFEYYGLNVSELNARWTGVNFTLVQLKDPTSTNVRPTIVKQTNTGTPPCGGFLIWKSRFGGWMHWGFKIQNRTFSKKYKGSLSVGMFESTLDSAGNPYTSVDYTGISTSYTRTLKSLSLSSEELLAVSGIHASTAIYYQRAGTSELELMRLSSHQAPISSLSNGGDFSVTLQSISKTSQLTM